MRHRNLAALPSTLILAALLLAACRPAPLPEKPLVYGLTLSPSGIDPHLNASAELGIPLTSVYDTLVVQDAGTGQFLPSLAERWEISPDGRRYTFFLREDVYFHDGTPFDAEAVRANIEYTLDPENHSQKAAGMLGPLADVRVDGPYQVSLLLSEPFAPLLDSLSQVYLGMASPQALEEWGPAQYQFHQVGTGPYRFIEYVPNDHITLRRFDEYAWAPPIYENDQAAIEEITFVFFEDPSTRPLALETHQADILGEVPHRDAARLASTDAFNLHQVDIPGQPQQFFFNVNREPTNDLRVRQALTQAVDREKIVETVFGGYAPVAQGPLSAAYFDGMLPCAELEYRPGLAAQLLDEAGWRVDPADGLRKRGGQAMRLLLVAPTWGANPDVAQLIKADWESLGAEVEIQVMPGFGPLKEAQASGTYHAIGLNFFGTDADLLRSFFHSDGFFNWSGYADSSLDRMLVDASQTTLDPQARAELYTQAMDLIMGQALILPVRDYSNLVVSDSRVQGLRFTLQGWFPLLIDLDLSS